MKKILALALALVMVFALAACGGESGEKLSFGTGGDSGTYYAFGTHFAVASSDDLINWEQLASDNDYAKLYGENVEPLEDYPAWPTALKETLELVKPKSDTKTTWAPDVE